MKVLLSLILMFFSANLLAAFQNQLSASYQSASDENRDINSLRLDYLYLLSPVKSNSVPYAEEIFISHSNRVHFMIGQSSLDYDVDPFTGDSLDTDVDTYGIDGIFHLPDTSYYIGLGYQYLNAGSVLNDANGDGFAEAIVRFNGIEGPDVRADKAGFQLGYYINPMSEIAVFLSQTDTVHDLGNIDFIFESKFYGLEYRQLFELNEQYFTLNVMLGSEKITSTSAEFGNLGLDDESRKLNILLNYYVNKSTKFSMGVNFTKNEMLEVNEERNTKDYVLGIEYYINSNIFSSVGYFDVEERNSNGYYINLGYRF